MGGTYPIARIVAIVDPKDEPKPQPFTVVDQEWFWVGTDCLSDRWPSRHLVQLVQRLCSFMPEVGYKVLPTYLRQILDRRHKALPGCQGHVEMRSYFRDDAFALGSMRAPIRCFQPDAGAGRINGDDVKLGVGMSARGVVEEQGWRQSGPDSCQGNSELVERLGIDVRNL